MTRLWRAPIAGVVSLLLVSQASGQTGSDILPFVDPLIGTANGGHVFAGATLPFGMAKAVPDSVNDGQGGFSTTGGGPITGFSHMHDSGTGGVSLAIEIYLFASVFHSADSINALNSPSETRGLLKVSATGKHYNA